MYNSRSDPSAYGDKYPKERIVQQSFYRKGVKTFGKAFIGCPNHFGSDECDNLNEFIKSQLGYDTTLDDTLRQVELLNLEYLSGYSIWYYFGHGVENRDTGDFIALGMATIRADRYYSLTHPDSNPNHIRSRYRDTSYVFADEIEGVMPADESIEFVFINGCVSGESGAIDFKNAFNADVYLGWEKQPGGNNVRWGTASKYAIEFFNYTNQINNDPAYGDVNKNISVYYASSKAASSIVGDHPYPIFVECEDKAKKLRIDLTK